MSSTGPEQVNEFKGKGGAECENFIKSIRKAAWKEGKVRDALWMADFASLHFSGKALKWHSDLSPDVRQDWFKQEKALLERWPPPADDSDKEEAEAAIVPIPAAASLPGRSTQEVKFSDIGVVQFVPISEDAMYIAEPDGGGECRLTTEVEKALRLRWDRSVDSESRVLEWVGSGSKWLAIHWMKNDLTFDQGSRMWARLTVVDPTTLTPASSAMSPSFTHFRINVWKLSSGGRTTVMWNDSGRALELKAFTNRGYMFITVDGDAYQKANPNEIQGRLVFKSME